MKKSLKYTLLGTFFILLQAMIIYYVLVTKRYHVLFWYCNHIPIVFGLLFFFKKTQMIKALINIGLIGQILWTIDLISKFLFNKHIIGTTNYIFENPFSMIIIVPIIAHTLSILVTIFFVYKIKQEKKYLIYPLIYLIFIFIITISFAPVELNTNCVYEFCGLEKYTFKYYTLIWPFLAFVLLVIPGYLFQEFLYKISRKKKIEII